MNKVLLDSALRELSGRLHEMAFDDDNALTAAHKQDLHDAADLVSAYRRVLLGGMDAWRMLGAPGDWSGDIGEAMRAPAEAAEGGGA